MCFWILKNTETNTWTCIDRWSTIACAYVNVQWACAVDVSPVTEAPQRAPALSLYIYISGENFAHAQSNSNRQCALYRASLTNVDQVRLRVLYILHAYKIVSIPMHSLGTRGDGVVALEMCLLLYSFPLSLPLSSPFLVPIYSLKGAKE